MDTILSEFYRLLPSYAKRKALVDMAELICEQIPTRRVVVDDLYVDYEDELNASDGNEDFLDSEGKINSILRQSIPWRHDVAQFLGDELNFVDALDYALGDDQWFQALGGWERDDEWLMNELSQGIDRVSETYPGFRPSWETEVVQDFFDDWRRNFYSRLLKLAKEA